MNSRAAATVVPISSKVACPTLSSQVVFYSHPIVALLMKAVIANVENRIILAGWRGSTGGPTSQRPKSNDDNDERTHKKTLNPLKDDL